MTGFFEILAARAVGAAPALRPAAVPINHAPVPHLPLGVDLAHREVSPEWGTPAAPNATSRDAPLHETAREGMSDQIPKKVAIPDNSTEPVSGPAAFGRQTTPSAESTAASTSDSTVPAPTRQQHPVRSSAAARRELRALTETAVDDVLGSQDRPVMTSSDHEPTLARKPAEGEPPEGKHTTPPRTEEPQTSTSSKRQQPAELEAGDTSDFRERGPVPQDPFVQPRRRRVTAPASPPRTETQPDIDLPAMLREQVYAALAQRGDVSSRERPVTVPPGQRIAPPPPGSVTLEAQGVSTTGRVAFDSAPDDTTPSGPPTINLHIDRVSVTRAAPPPPPAARPARPRVDHTAYLGRRRGHS